MVQGCGWVQGMESNCVDRSLDGVKWCGLFPQRFGWVTRMETKYLGGLLGLDPMVGFSPRMLIGRKDCVKW